MAIECSLLTRSKLRLRLRRDDDDAHATAEYDDEGTCKADGDSDDDDDATTLATADELASAEARARLPPAEWPMMYAVLIGVTRGLLSSTKVTLSSTAQHRLSTGGRGSAKRFSLGVQLWNDCLR